MAEMNQFGLSADPTVIVAIDNPHLAIGPRVQYALRMLMASLPTAEITVVSNMPCPAEFNEAHTRWLALPHHGPIANETQFFADFAEFAAVPLLAETTLPESGLSLFDAVGFDGLIYPYRSTCELDVSSLDRIDPHTRQVIVVGGSHFNHPLPECVLAKLTEASPCLGLPIGPLTGPFAPHWLTHCDRFVVADKRQSEQLKRLGADMSAIVRPSLDGVDSANNSHRSHLRRTLMIDWTFAHTASLRQLLEAMCTDDRIIGTHLILTACSGETSELLAKKWPAIIERLTPTFIVVNSDAWHAAVADADVAVTFAGGRDLWNMRRKRSATLVCDFADWCTAFGCDDVDALTCVTDAARAIADTLAAGGLRSSEDAQ